MTATGTDLQDGTLAASRFTWTLAIEHCPSNCHEHIVSSKSGTKIVHLQRAGP